MTLTLFSVLARGMTGPIDKTQSPSKKLRIMIDPGHGGRDPGAVVKGLKESTLNLNSSRILKGLLERDADHFDVEMTRNSDIYLSLEQRKKRAENFESDLFLTVHCNSSPHKKAKGTELYIGATKGDEEIYHTLKERLLNLQRRIRSLELAREIQKHWPSPQSRYRTGHGLNQQDQTGPLDQNQDQAQIQRHRPKVKNDNFFLPTFLDIPSLLIELGYMTNDAELQILRDQRQIARYAMGLRKALLAYKENLDKVPQPVKQKPHVTGTAHHPTPPKSPTL